MSANSADPQTFPPTSLDRLQILTIDCQTTGATPDKGRLLEIGFMPGCAAKSDPAQARACLIRQPAGATFPPAVIRITGISEADLCRAVPESVAWQMLFTAARHLATRNHSTLCPAIIHFARFERPFLHCLHQSRAPGTIFPFQIVCTHSIAQRLLPELPRRGLRAVAGYFGHTVSESKRSAEHARATMAIWKNLVALLQTHCGVNTLVELDAWLSETPRPVRSRRVFPMDAAIRCTLPDRPGIYRMRRSNGTILYIGKAKSLKQRVNSYFRSGAAHAEHILEMLSQARALDHVTTGSALEAAILENDEIKRHCPPYNIALRPDGRALKFAARDLTRWSSHYDSIFTVGPLFDGRWTEALSAFAAWLDTGPPDASAREPNHRAILGVRLEGGPDSTVLQEGFALFRKRHAHRLTHGALRAVTSIGAQLWRSKMAEDACESELQSADDPDQFLESGITPPAQWTPADIADAVERALMQAARLIRRARWFLMLADASLAWAAPEDPYTLKNLLVFEKGTIVDRRSLLPGQRLPAPPGWRRPWDERRKHLTLLTCDRMRVVTTELRRLLCTNRAIELRLSPGTVLTCAQLRNVLRWI
jgi:DNA polymerase III subunit epsilon